MPKLYFYDTGLACSLLGIEAAQQLETHPLRGALFETFVTSELVKRRYNKGLQSNLYFWRDKTGHEVDVIVDRGTRLIPIEIKSGTTLASDMTKNLHIWMNLSGQKNVPGYLVYAGKESFVTHGIETCPRQSLRSINLG